MNKRTWIYQGMALLLVGACGSTAFAQKTFSVTDLRCEDLVDPIGVDVAKPRLSWRMKADHNGAAQTAYRVLCATSPKLLREGAADLWDSAKVESNQSQHVVYGGEKIKRGVPSYWTVRIWNEKGDASDWSKPAIWTSFDMTANEDWQAKWITQNDKGTTNPWMRGSFQMRNVPERAYIYVNALGYFQLFINGNRVGNDEFAPHVGQYNNRTFSRSYDVAKHLKKGKNTIGFWLGNGWNRPGRMGAGVNTTPSLRAQLEMTDAEGKTRTVITDENWRVKPSFMTYTGKWEWNNFGGEVHDARLEEPDWASTDYDDSAWSSAKTTEIATPVVSAERLQRNKVIETITPVNVSQVGQNGATSSWLVDMGKAMTGTVEITFPEAPEGHEISMEFGDNYSMKNGNVDVNSFRQKSTYISRGSGVERFENRFNYASFRYIHIENAPAGEISPEDVKGHFITTDLPKASTFECSDETLNDIYAMMEHTLRCLMLGGYQVDCHSRERQGYGGDGHASLDTTLSLFRTDAFYRKWLRDWLDGQSPDGGFSHTSPASHHGGGPFWAGFPLAATLKHYHHYGDIELVRQNFPAIKRWLELARSKTVNDLQERFTGRWSNRRIHYLGDWASPRGTHDSQNAPIVIHAYMAYALEQAAQLADALGEVADAKTFRQRAAARNAATHEAFYDPQEKKYGRGDQVTYVLPLMAGVVPDALYDQLFAEFENTLLVKDKGHLSTGLVGTYMMIQYLQSIGRDDLIYRFASKTTYPSWGYMIENGATATWEHWNGRHSRIHNCFNSIASWFIQGLAGIRPDTARPGFQNAIIKPAVLKQLSYVHASHDTLYGTIHSSWERDGDTITINVRIPANSTATVYVPAASVDDFTVNGKPVKTAEHVTLLRMEKGKAILRVASGGYAIVSQARSSR